LSENLETEGEINLGHGAKLKTRPSKKKRKRPEQIGGDDSVTESDKNARNSSNKTIMKPNVEDSIK